MTLALPSRRSALLPGRWASNELWRRARAVPSLDLRFAENKSLVDAITGANLVTFTRASAGTYVGSDGLIKTATTDAPRFDHNPTTGESLGLLVEESRSNSIRNNTMVGAVAGTPGTLPTNWTIVGSLGTLTQAVVGSGTSAGIAYIDVRFSGTTSTGAVGVQFEGFTQIAASSGQTWTGSFWVSRVAGSTTNLNAVSIRVHERDVVGASLANTSVDFLSTLSTTLARNTATRTMVSASTAFVTLDVLLVFASGVSIDITLRIGLPQLEQGAFATSVIPTSGTAVTRAADVASIAGANFSSWFNASEGSLFVSADRQQQIPATDFAQLFFMHDGSNNNTISLGWLTSGSGQFRVRAVSANEANLLDFSTALSRRIAGAYAVNNAASSINGSSPSSDLSVALPTGINTVSIGSDQQGLTRHNGTIRRLTFWPQRLSNNVLQALTR